MCVDCGRNISKHAKGAPFEVQMTLADRKRLLDYGRTGPASNGRPEWCRHVELETVQIVETGRVWLMCRRCKSLRAQRPNSTPFTRQIATSERERLHTEYAREESRLRDEWQRREVAAERGRWFAEHDAYLKTPEWRNLRALVLKRDGGKCQGCLVANATQVHHLHYRRWKRELACDLVSLCDRCHERAHEEPRP